MGLDGGTKITRSDVLRGQSWRIATRDDTRSTRGGSVSACTTLAERRLDKETTKRIRWTTCALSEQPLESPLAADRLGNVYNFGTVLRFLLNRKGVFDNDAERHAFANVQQKCPERFGHLRRRRDVFELHVQTDTDALIECPATGLNCLSTPFSALATCGHVFADRAVTQMKDMRCMKCNVPFEQRAVIHLNSENAETQKKLRQNLQLSDQKNAKTTLTAKRKTDAAALATKQRKLSKKTGPPAENQS